MGRTRKLFIFDYDGIISAPEKEKLKKLNLVGREVLEWMGWSIAKNSSIPGKLYLYGIVAPFLKIYKKIADIDKERYERRILEMFERMVFSLKPYWNWIEKDIPKYSECILETAEHFLRELSRKEDGKAVILSSGAPKNIIEDCLEYRGIDGIEITANSLLILYNRIYGFEKDSFFSDRKGKKEKTKEIVEEYNPEEIKGAGDNYSDKGVAQVIKKRGGEFFTISDGDKDLIEYVKKKFGEEYVVSSPRTIFSKFYKELLWII